MGPSIVNLKYLDAATSANVATFCALYQKDFLVLFSYK